MNDRDKKEYTTLINTWNRVATTDQGREVLRDILREAGVWGSSFDPESERITCFREGKRAIGLFILDRLNEVDSKVLQQVLGEQINE